MSGWFCCLCIPSIAHFIIFTPHCSRLPALKQVLGALLALDARLLLSQSQPAFRFVLDGYLSMLATRLSTSLLSDVQLYCTGSTAERSI